MLDCLGTHPFIVWISDVCRVIHAASQKGIAHWCIMLCTFFVELATSKGVDRAKFQSVHLLFNEAMRAKYINVDVNKFPLVKV